MQWLVVRYGTRHLDSEARGPVPDLDLIYVLYVEVQEESN